MWFKGQGSIPSWHWNLIVSSTYYWLWRHETCKIKEVVDSSSTLSQTNWGQATCDRLWEAIAWSCENEAWVIVETPRCWRYQSCETSAKETSGTKHLFISVPRIFLPGYISSYQYVTECRIETQGIDWLCSLLSMNQFQHCKCLRVYWKTDAKTESDWQESYWGEMAAKDKGEGSQKRQRDDSDWNKTLIALKGEGEVKMG